MTEMPATLTRETPTSVLFDQLTPLVTAKYTPRHSKGNPEIIKAQVDAELADLAAKNPTLGDLADNRYPAVYGSSYRELKLDAIGQSILDTLKQADVIRPLTLESTPKEMALHFLEHSQQPEGATKNLYTAVCHRLLGFGLQGDEATVAKNFKSQPYKNVGEIVADGKNARLALNKAWHLGPKGSDLLFDYLHSQGIGDGRYQGIGG